MTPDAQRSMRWRRSSLLALVMLPALLVGCGGSDAVEWPGVRFDLPAGWEVLDVAPQRLVLADHLAAEGERGVTVTFLRSPGVLPDTWRGTVAERGALLESDEAVRIAGDVPATQLVLLDTVQGTAVRETLLVVPSRELVIAVTPRVAPGDTDGPDLLLEALDEVRTFLDGIELAVPGLR
jgi:hypothetical protein